MAATMVMVNEVAGCTKDDDEDEVVTTLSPFRSKLSKLLMNSTT